MHVSHLRTGGDLAFSDVAIDLQIETKGSEHCAAVLAGLRAAGYRIGDA
jgi:threonine dehydratase